MKKQGRREGQEARPAKSKGRPASKGTWARAHSQMASLRSRDGNHFNALSQGVVSRSSQPEAGESSTSVCGSALQWWYIHFFAKNICAQKICRARLFSGQSYLKLRTASVGHSIGSDGAK